jgi:hypothetical protein
MSPLNPGTCGMLKTTSLKTSVTPSADRTVITPSRPAVPSTMERETAGSPGKSTYVPSTAITSSTFCREPAGQSTFAAG